MLCIDLRRLECAEGTQNNAHPMRVGDTLQHNYQHSSVPPARRIRTPVPTPHGTSLSVGLIRLRAFSTYIGH